MSRDPLDGLLSLDDPGAGPALPIARAEAERLVEAALAQAFPVGGGGSERGGVAGAPGGVARAPLVGASTIAKAIAIATLALGGGAALVGREALPPPQGAESAAAVPVAAPASREAETPAVFAREQAVISPQGGPQPLATGKGGVRSRVPNAVAMPEVVLSDLELLGAANAARRERRWRDADALYSKVVEAFPAGSVAAVAAIASGELRLELLGDAEGARDRFRFATTRGEAHAVDAYEGLLKACGALHDAGCEREARVALEARHAAPKEKTSAP